MFVAPNCRFEVDDASLEWTYPPSTFDYIHVRALYGSIADWPKFYREVYTYAPLGASGLLR
jgi:hypothetical protein